MLRFLWEWSLTPIEEYPTCVTTNDSYCINVGNGSNKTWYPADMLRILDWQVAKGQIHDIDDMVGIATRTTSKNKDFLRGLVPNQPHRGIGLKELGIDPLKSFYAVSR